MSVTVDVRNESVIMRSLRFHDGDSNENVTNAIDYNKQNKNYNTRHKSLRQEPFVLNFLQISYIHSSHLCSHSNVPLSFPNVELRIFWSTERTANPNQHWGGENHTSVSRFVTKIVGTRVTRFGTFR